MAADDEQVFQQNQAIDGALRTADAAEKFSFTAFLSTTGLSLVGVGGMTLPFFALPFLILGRLFYGMMTSLHNIEKKNLNLSNMTELAVSMILAVLPMLIIMISMTSMVHAVLIAQLMTLGTVFFGISSVYHFGGIFANLFKAMMAPTRSDERKAYLQQAFKHTINCFISMALFALIAFSFAPPVTLGLLGAVSIVSTLYIAWSFFPKLRNTGKRLFGLAKADETLTRAHNLKPSLESTNIKSPESKKIETSHYGHFFKRAYRREVIRHYIEKNQLHFAKSYLLQQIEAFQEKYKKQFPDLSSQDYPKKQKEKLQALTEAKALLMSPPDSPAPTFTGPKTIKEIIETHPLCEQSFFADVSDTLDILEAVELYLDYDKPIIEALPSP